jgi:hypothetical protein
MRVRIKWSIDVIWKRKKRRKYIGLWFLRLLQEVIEYDKHGDEFAEFLEKRDALDVKTKEAYLVQKFFIVNF